jgi:hypothetical protein
MAYTACLVCLIVLSVAAAKNALLRGNASSGHITKLEQSRFSFDIYGFEQSSSLIYLCYGLF